MAALLDRLASRELLGAELHVRDFAFFVFEIEESLSFAARQEVGTADALLQLVDQQARCGCPLKNSCSEMSVGLQDLPRNGGIELPSAPLNAGDVLEFAENARIAHAKVLVVEAHFEQLAASTRDSRMFSWIRARCSSGISVPNCCDQRACVSLQALVASAAGIFSPSTSAAS